jgi:hypothetical protein
VRTAAAPDLAPIESRLSKLESAPAPAGDAAALGALDARIKTLEERKVETPPDLGDLPSRVARLEESMNALAETAKEGGSVPDAAALDAKIGDLEQRLQGKIDSALAAQQGESATDLKGLQKEVEALKAKLGALAEAHLAGDTSDLAPQLTTLDQRIAKLETALPELSKSLIPDPGDLGALPSHAETGVPTVAELSANLTKLAEASAAPPTAPAETSILDSMMASAKSAISIRRVGADVTGDEPAAMLARAEASLQQGDLEAAIKEVETLPAPTRDAFAHWLDDARARVSANDSLSKLESTVLASLGGGSSPEAKP